MEQDANKNSSQLPTLTGRAFWSIADISRATGQTDAAVRGTLTRARVRPAMRFGKTQVFPHEVAQLVAHILDLRRRADTFAAQLSRITRPSL